ncbi:helix-turn-helix domain-containing protein [Aureimonas leprariae]|uniref:Helix-turn-helix transcriptional regulator n=1 Tax=Plantimonas leprariae TaxID=2615207 RepID=A0A7V7PRN7_9HYPH|nr:AraC family transcriptional regulator [Aureimonas leprariae]KAB0681449.1 helix-turn-helix transcriptional regulator [Aureimonas leprariae]
MPLVPLPFVVTALLAVVMLRMLRERGEDGFGPHDAPFVALVGAYALGSVLIGLRWGYDMRAVLPAQSVLATVIAALAYLSFSGLAGEAARRSKVRLALHAVPAVAVAALQVLGWREVVAPAIILVFLGYGGALAKLALEGPDALALARLDGALRSFRALQVTAAAILASAATDVLISLDYGLFGGVHSGALVAAANVVALLVLAFAASSVRVGGAGEEPAADVPETSMAPSEADRAVAVRLDRLMAERRFYADPELNLSRIARRLALPARRVSAAVNRVHGTSVSQYVNGFRIGEACQRLASTGDPVTKVMFEAGFLSKSNFNREFLRVTGASPTAWRKARHPAPALDERPPADALPR